MSQPQSPTVPSLQEGDLVKNSVNTISNIKARKNTPEPAETADSHTNVALTRVDSKKSEEYFETAAPHIILDIDYENNNVNTNA